MTSMSVEESKKVQLDILSAVDQFCRENGIRYYLSYGTLLGAIRHDGFIPWDDDIDITMPYPDYKRFIQTFEHDVYRVKSVFTDSGYPFHLVKIDDKRIRLIEHSAKEFEIGVNIDLSPLIGLPLDMVKANRHFKLIDFWRSKVLLAKNVVRKKRRIIKQIPIEFIKALPVSRQYIIRRIDALSAKYNYDESKYVICVGSFNLNDEIATREIFSDVEEHMFEGRLFRIPKGWDEWLHILFGDYLKLPPEEKRVTHHDFECYWK